MEARDPSDFPLLLVNLGQARSTATTKAISVVQPPAALSIKRDALLSKILANFVA